jgi:Tol biopolymer transport system component
VALDGEQANDLAELRIETGTVGLFPDWTSDGRSLIYTKPDRTGGGGSEAEISLGYLVSRQVVGEAAELLIDGPEERKAWLLFYEQGRVRCLQDGRILCSAIEAKFPVTDADLPQSDQLYQFDPDRSATLTRVLPAQTLANLPDLIAFYEVSPDGSKLVVADWEMSQVFVVDLASGDSYSLQTEDLSDIAWMPSWTTDEQLCFRGRMPNVDPEEEKAIKQPVEVLLWDGENLRAISHEWPDDLRRSLDLESVK